MGPNLNLNNSFIDLFAGAGGFSAGFINAGWKCIAAIEYDPDATKTYWLNLCLGGWSSLKCDPDNEKALKALQTLDPFNQPTFDYDIPDDNWLVAEGKFPALSIWNMDITKLDPYAVMDEYHIPSGELAAIVGGPPCQGFSWANCKRDQGDDRNQMAFRFLDYVEAIKPKTFIIENVQGILSLGKLKGDKEGPFPVWIRERAESIGYNLTYQVHNCGHFGVPQNRKRVLFFGTRKDLNMESQLTMKPTHTYDYFTTVDNPQLSLFNEKPEGEPFVTVFEAIGDLDIPLSSYRDSDAKELPYGHRGRGPSQLTPTNYYKEGDTYYMQDRFTGDFFLVPAVDWNHKSKDHYEKCFSCGRFNLKVRDRCHYCEIKLDSYQNKLYLSGILETKRIK